ncbi:MAG: GldG family protein [Verrucomicrobia bacterium]|nr:GldG family protein [Verrucomicrobiota bacterium]
MDAEPPTSFQPARLWSSSLNVGVSIAALLALVLMTNYLAVRHFQRFDWTNNNHKLSPLTLYVLRSLTNDIHVTVFFQRSAPLRAPVSALLNEYRLASPRIQVNEVEYRQDTATGEQIKEKYQLSFTAAKNVIIFDGYGQTNMVLEKELSEYDLSKLQPGLTNEIKPVGFKGEQLFTSAIVRVTDPRVFKACFLRGHGQEDPTNEDPVLGFSKLVAQLAQNHIAVSRLSLLGTNSVPADCQLLIIAGPKEPFEDGEVEKIEKYLGQGGRLLALLRPMLKPGAGRSGLEPLLARWGVEVGENWVIDPEGQYRGGIVATNFSGHAIVRGLAEGGDNAVIVTTPRSIERLRTTRKGADAPQVEELFRTSRSSQIVTRLENQRLFPTTRDRRGEVPIAVAVEKGNIEGISANRRATRIVVVGDCAFLNNTMINNDGNYNFARLAVSWLQDRPSLLGGIGPRPIREIQLTITSGQLHVIRWLLLGAIPGSVMLLGTLVWWRRRY